MTHPPRILVVDDDEAILTVITALLGQEGIAVTTARRGDDALRELTRGDHRFGAMICDLKMPGLDGLALLERAHEHDPDLSVVMLTAHGTIEVAVEAMKRGACDFVTKPFVREELLFVVHKALHRRSHSAAHPRRRAVSGLARLVGDSPALARAKAILSRVAPRDATVLLRGETGTGKELAARAVHDLSPRASGPFVRVHCAALPDTLLESELFGHEAGAFTGAVRKKPGRVELAEGGTLFLDEIGDASPVVQVKLLHLLQEGEYCPLGSTAHKRADVRFVAATHRDLEAMVAEGTFREDLFYRLHVLPVTLPPLRARVGDVPLLVRALAEDLLSSGGSAARGFSEAALERLGAEAWPGNVRQLKNVVDRLLILAEGDEVTLDEVETELGDAPPHRSAALGEASLRAQRRAVEQNAVERALREAGGNRSQAARLLGISRRTLYKKLGPQAAEK